MGERAVRRALGELEAAGYRHRFRIRDYAGRLRTVTVFSDVPVSREEAMADVDAEDRARMIGHAHADGSEGFPQAESPESFPQDERPIGHRAAPPAARWQNPQDSGEKSGSTVRRSTVARSTVPRSTVPRSTVPRSDAALSLRDTNTSSLRSEVTFNQTGPDLTNEVISPADSVADSGGVGSGREDADVGGDDAGGAVGSASLASGRGLARMTRPALGPVPGSGGPPGPGSGPGGTGASGGSGHGRRPGGETESTPQKPSSPPRAADQEPGVPRGGSGSDRRSDRLSAPQGDRSGSGAGGSGDGGLGGLLGSCLPERMRVLDPEGARVVAGLLVERLDAGWRPEEIMRVMDQRLPASVGRLSSLVAHRLRVNVDPGLAPMRGSPAVDRLGMSDDERFELARRRSEELAAERPCRGDPAFGRAFEEARLEMPGADHLALARRAADILRVGVCDE